MQVKDKIWEPHVYILYLLWSNHLCSLPWAQIRRFANRERGHKGRVVPILALLKAHRCHKCLAAEQGVQPTFFCLSMEDLRVFNLFCRYSMTMYFKHICNTFGKRMPWCLSSWKTTNWLLWKVTMTLIRLVITTCWQDWSALISGKQKLDQRKTMQNWNCRAPQELQFGKAHIIAFSQNNKRSICDFSTGSFSLFCHIHKCVSFPFPPIQTFWHICSIGNAF